jgi:hypothetical protein
MNASDETKDEVVQRSVRDELTGEGWQVKRGRLDRRRFRDVGRDSHEDFVQR